MKVMNKKIKWKNTLMKFLQNHLRFILIIVERKISWNKNKKFLIISEILTRSDSTVTTITINECIQA